MSAELSVCPYGLDCPYNCTSISIGFPSTKIIINLLNQISRRFGLEPDQNRTRNGLDQGCQTQDININSLKLTILCIGEIIVVNLLNINRVHFVRFFSFGLKFLVWKILWYLDGEFFFLYADPLCTILILNTIAYSNFRVVNNLHFSKCKRVIRPGERLKWSNQGSNDDLRRIVWPLLLSQVQI